MKLKIFFDNINTYFKMQNYKKITIERLNFNDFSPYLLTKFLQ